MSLTATVRRFRGCLDDLPHRLRRLLELRAGIGSHGPLSPAAVGVILHVTQRDEFSLLERRALRRLRRAASAGACSGAAVVNVAGSPIFASFGPADLIGAASGGVDAARYSESAPSTGAAVEQPTASGLSLASAGAGSIMLLVAAIVVGVAVIGFLVADNLGTGPGDPLWRSRWVRRFRRH
jgi:hypothetical protein